MKEKELETTTVDLAAGRYVLRATATRTLFDGFAAVYTEGRDDGEDETERSLPPLRPGDETEVAAVTPTQHFTEPPPRFTEASLVKALEENGIGRPSTYAATISTIVDRGYVVVRERRLHPEAVAEVVTDLLVDNVGEYVDLAFTARMEEGLDEVARGERPWVPLLRDFYARLRESVGAWPQGRPTWPTDEVCSLGHPMVIRFGKNGRFLACSLFPEHKESRPLPGEEPETSALAGVGETCPECGEADGGELVAKRGRFGPFVGCNRYPDCRYIRKDGPPPPDPLAVRGPVPDVRRRPPRGPAGAAHRVRLLGLLALPEVRLHDVPRATRAGPRRGRWPPRPGRRRDGPLPPAVAPRCRSPASRWSPGAGSPAASRTRRPSPDPRRNAAGGPARRRPDGRSAASTKRTGTARPT